MNIRDFRQNYSKYKLDIETVNKNPIIQFENWLNEAILNQVPEPTAMNLATSDDEGNISSRIVLLKGFSEKGFTFFTNYESQKGQQIAKNSKAALNFFWPLLERQVRIEGKISKITASESDEYFLSRPIESQISAIISPQSTKIKDKNELDSRRNELIEVKKDLQRPNYWGGYLLEPVRIEFWQGRENRLHDRINFVLSKNKWEIHRLAP